MSAPPDLAPRWPGVLTAALGLAWLAAVPLGLHAALIPPDAHGDPAARASRVALLYVPGLVLVALGALIAARRFFAATATWRPGRPVPGLARRSEPTRRPRAPTPPPAPRPPPARPEPVAAPRAASPSSSAKNHAPHALVTLGAGRSPAYAPFGLSCASPLLPADAPSFVALPPGQRLVLGRAPDADVLVGLAEVSWHHLALDVAEDGVTVSDLGSTNGTTLLRAGSETAVPLIPQEATALAAGDTLALAAPVALTLTLEALR